MPEVKYVAIDPGESTGWATFLDDGKPTEFGILSGRDEVYEFLKGLPHNITIIVEDFSLFPGKAMGQVWSRLETVRVIGVIEFYCYLSGSVCIHQNPNIKTIAYKWAGLQKPKNHSISHGYDAMVHGVYYLQKNGIRQPQQGVR